MLTTEGVPVANVTFERDAEIIGIFTERTEEEVRFFFARPDGDGTRYTFHLLRVVIAGAAYPIARIVIFVIGVTIDPVSVLVVQAGQAAGRLLAVTEDTLVDDAGEVSVFIIFIQFFCERIWLGELTKSIF